MPQCIYYIDREANYCTGVCTHAKDTTNSIERIKECMHQPNFSLD